MVTLVSVEMGSPIQGGLPSGLILADNKIDLQTRKPPDEFCERGRNASRQLNSCFAIK